MEPTKSSDVITSSNHSEKNPPASPSMLGYSLQLGLTGLKALMSAGWTMAQPYIDYSLRARTKQVQMLAAEGKAKNIESMRVFDLSAFPYFIKKAHFVVHPSVVQQGLGNIELKHSLSPYPSQLDQLIGKDNMLLCPYAQHRRLRSPIEKNFSKKEIIKFAPDIVKVTIGTFIRSYLLDNHPRFADLALGHTRMISSGTIKKILDIKETTEPSTPIDPQNTSDVACALRKDQRLSPLEVSSTLNLLLAAGEETTERTLSFLFELLSTHPEIVNEIKKEWEEFQNQYPAKDLEDLAEKLTIFALGGEIEGNSWPFSRWLNAALKETLRLYPAVTELRRVAQNECSLDGIAIKARDIVLFDIFGAHHNSKEWDNPDHFDPRRFLNDERSLWHSHTRLLNFSTGSKKCIGQELAKLELLIAGAIYAIFSAKEWTAPAAVADHRQQKPLHLFSEVGFINTAFPILVTS